MADLGESSFLLRMRRLEAFRMSSSIKDPVLFKLAFEASEMATASKREERDPRPFSIRYARDFLDVYETIQFRECGYHVFVSSVSVDKVADLMEEDWFVNAVNERDSHDAVQRLWLEIATLEDYTAEEFTSVEVE